MDEPQILSSLRLLIEQEWAVRKSSNPQIVLETVVLELCQLKRLTSVGGLLGQLEEGKPIPLPPAPAATPVLRNTAPASSPSSRPAATPAPYTPKPPSSIVVEEGENVLAVEEIEDPLEAEKDPEMAKLKSQWREFLEKVGTQKKSLEGVLTDTRPKSLEEGTLVLVCKGPFHHEQLSNPENKKLVEQVLKDFLGRPVTLVPVLAEGDVSPTKPSPLRSPRSFSASKMDPKELEKEEPIVAAVTKLFNGVVVEVKRNTPQK